MDTENKNPQMYDFSAVNTIVMANFKHSIIVVSLLTNLTVFVTWLVVMVG